MNMKANLSAFFVCAATVAQFQSHAQDSTAPAPPTALDTGSASTAADAYAAVERGPHHAVWQRLTVDAQGVTNTHSYTELATGLNFWNPALSRWEETKELFQITDKGYAIATNGQHKLVVTPDIAAPGGAIDFLGQDSQRLVSSPMGLAFRDTDSGKTVLIAGVTNCIGEMPEPNVIVFPKAFDTLKAAISYTYRRAGIEQDVILYQQLPSPADYGFDPQTTACEIWTEFLGAPQPAVSAVDASGDQALDFGQTRMGHGVAYLLNASELEPVPLQKTWAVIDGRQFLVESVPYRTLEPLLAKLQASVPAPSNGRAASVSFSDRKGFVELALRTSPKLTQGAQMASIRPGRLPHEVGLCLDYQTLNTSQTNYTFAADTTYYITSGVNLAGTNNVIEGGAVIKFTNSTAAKLSFTQGGMICNTAPYRMAIFTSQDDNSVGASISGSTGSPTNYPGATYLNTPGTALKHLRFCYAGTAVYDGTYANSVWHCQFINCSMGIHRDSADVVLKNVLFSGCSTCVETDYDIFGEHLTVDACSVFAHHHADDGWITNSIFTASSVGPVTLYYSLQQSSSSGIYQTAGAGSYYLCDGSTNRDIGTTNIDPNLLLDLRQKTTYPPPVLSSTITTDTTLSPQAQRDTDVPDLGYHYDPIDYIPSIVTVTNCTLTLAPGTALACYNQAGFWLREGSSVISKGTPLAPIWSTRYQAVQEQPVSLGLYDPAQGFCLDPYHTGTPAPAGVFRFTRFSCPANGGIHFYDSSWGFGSLQLQDSELWGGANKFDGAANTVAVLDNNLFHRGSFYLFDSATNALAISNNLLRFVTGIVVRQLSTSSWAIYNNEFDSCTFSLTLALTSSGNNAYWTCNKQLNPTNASDITLTNAIAYQAGPLGTFYQLTNSPLINMGSCTADLTGLYHYTVTTNLVSGFEIKETNSIVDIGYHYVATDSNGIPIDTDGDGVPDCLEDLTGNGVYDSSAGETDWQSYNSLNGLTGATGLLIYTPLK